jgi:hypothetical protein
VPRPERLDLLERLVQRLLLGVGVAGREPVQGHRELLVERLAVVVLGDEVGHLGVDRLVRGGLLLGLFLLAEEAVEGFGQLVDLLLERLNLRVAAFAVPALGVLEVAAPLADLLPQRLEPLRVLGRHVVGDLRVPLRERLRVGGDVLAEVDELAERLRVEVGQPSMPARGSYCLRNSAASRSFGATVSELNWWSAWVSVS